MPEYKYSGDFERVFPVFHGPGVTVVRREAAEGEVPFPEQPDGASVLLRPGDVLVTDEPVGFYHCELPGSEDPTPEASPEPVEDAPVALPEPKPSRRKTATDNTATDAPPASDATA